jgi:hypothetical protein
MAGEARTRTLTLIAGAVLLALGLRAGAQQAARCDPVGPVAFICGQVAPEDFAVLPGSQWVLASGMAANGAIRLINARDRTSTILFPTDAPTERLDAAAYPSCPGPLNPAERARFRAHGFYLQPGRASVHTLLMVHHGERESVEVFQVDVSRKVPALTWVGCAMAPEKTSLNSVVALPDGGFAATNFQTTGATSGKLPAGEITGEVWEWRATSGWQKVPGSELSGPNGIEISKDGRTFYIASWGSQTIVRLSRGQTPVKLETTPVGFRPDNLRWAPDGRLLAAGQGGTGASAGSYVARVDPSTLKAEEIIRHPNSPAFSSGTVAIQMGQEIWVGSVRGDRIAVFPAPSSKP